MSCPRKCRTEVGVSENKQNRKKKKKKKEEGKRNKSSPHPSVDICNKLLVAGSLPQLQTNGSIFKIHGLW